MGIDSVGGMATGGAIAGAGLGLASEALIVKGLNKIAKTMPSYDCYSSFAFPSSGGIIMGRKGNKLSASFFGKKLKKLPTYCTQVGKSFKMNWKNIAKAGLKGAAILGAIGLTFAGLKALFKKS